MGAEHGPGAGVTMEPIDKSMMNWRHAGLAEQSPADWARTLASGGIRIWKPKTHQHLAFINHARLNPDTGPLAIGSLADVQRQYEEYGALGIKLLPWCVPMLTDVAAEADLAIAVARLCGGQIEIDLEVGEDFVSNSLPRQRILNYFDRLNAAGIVPDLDTANLPGWFDALLIAQLVPKTRRLLAQSYWIGFKETYQYRLKFDADALLAAGAMNFGIVGDCRAGRAEMLAAASFAQELGAAEWSCWGAHFATPETYAGMALIPTREEAPPVDKDTLWTQVVSAGHEVRDSADTAIYMATPGNTEVSEQIALDELYRISGIWQTKALEVRDLCLRLKG